MLHSHVCVNIFFPHSLRGIRKVSWAAYEACDLEAWPYVQWSSGREGGAVHVMVEEGSVHYFIDPVADNCVMGTKAKVSSAVGSDKGRGKGREMYNMEGIDWRGYETRKDYEIMRVKNENNQACLRER